MQAYPAAPLLIYLRRPCPGFVPVNSMGGQNVIFINDSIHYSRHNEGRDHIKNRVLFDEHGGQYNRRTEDKGSGKDSLPAGKAFCFYQGKMCGQGIVHMDARP